MAPEHDHDSYDPKLPPHIRWTRRLESATELDGRVGMLSRFADRLVASPRRAEALQGHWLGHALHPIMTDLPIGSWVSATVLDLIGGKQSRPAATRLVGVGIAAAVPTAVTGLAEWAVVDRPSQRVGLVHAASNSVALTLYAGSFLARIKGLHRFGVLLGLAGGSAAAVGGYLGGHLTEVRKVSTHHPAFDVPPENGEER